MSLHRLAALLFCVVLFGSSLYAQNSEFSGTIGRTFVSTQTIPGATFFNHDIHFGDGISFALNYGYKWKQWGEIGLTAELPIVVAPDTDLNTGKNIIPASYKAFFVTPSLRVNFFQAESVTPWVSAGGGYARFKMSGHEIYFGPNPGATNTNTGAIQFGAGLDVWPWQRLGFRLEARDFWSGHPDLGVDTGRSMQHNYYVGGGVLLRF